MGHLNSLVDFPEKTIRHNVLTILKKEGFRYYYVINEKDIEFDEDDKSGWEKIKSSKKCSNKKNFYEIYYNLCPNSVEFPFYFVEKRVYEQKRVS